jgi:hypothetical protein
VQLTHRFVIERSSRDREFGRDYTDIAVDTGYDGRLLELRDLDVVKEEIKPDCASNTPGVIPFVKHELGSHQFLELHSIITVHCRAPTLRDVH